MELKRSSCLFILLLCFCIGLKAQVSVNEFPVEEDSTIEYIYDDDNSENEYIGGYTDSETDVFNNRPLDKPVSDEVWRSVYQGVSFDTTEEKKSENTKKDKERSGDGFPRQKQVSTGGNLSWLWYTLAAGIMIALLIFLVPRLGLGKWNIRNRPEEELLIGDDNPDDETLKNLDLRNPYLKAYQEGNFRMAFRLRYLDLLRQLTRRNWIVYKKEKTNFDYLTQLRSKPVYSSFSRLTMAFDEIWYGDILPDRKQFDLYMDLFEEIGREVENA